MNLPKDNYFHWTEKIIKIHNNMINRLNRVSNVSSYIS